MKWLKELYPPAKTKALQRDEINRLRAVNESQRWTLADLAAENDRLRGWRDDLWLALREHAPNHPLLTPPTRTARATTGTATRAADVSKNSEEIDTTHSGAMQEGEA